MDKQILDIDLALLRNYLNQKLGLNFLVNQDKELIRKMEYAAKEFGHSNLYSFSKWLYSQELTKEQTCILASYLTIGETYFMREKKGFDFLEQIYLPDLITKRYSSNKRVRIWCAGCATGEEAYSLAITISRSIPNIKQWKISILASDINPNSLRKAKKAIYTKWSFRNTSPEFIQKYFSSTESGLFQLLPEIKEMVTFDSVNLARDNYADLIANKPPFDIIFCRNVLIYFSSEGALNVTNQFFDVLAAGGILVVSPVEVSTMISPKFNTLSYTGYTIYYKGEIPKELKSYATIGTGFRNIIMSSAAKAMTTVIREQTPIAPTRNSTTEEKTPFTIRERKRGKVQPNLEEAKDFFVQKQFEKVEEILNNQLIQVNDDNEENTLRMAKTKANLGKLKDAEQLCEKALSYNKLNPTIYYLLATIMQEQGEDEKAISLLEKTVYLNPDFVLAHFLNGSLYLKNGNTVMGNKSIKRALSCLSKFSDDEILPESGGITALRFKEIIQSITK